MTDKLREIVEGEMRRLGIPGVRVRFRLVAEFQDGEGRHRMATDPGIAADFLSNLSAGDVKGFSDFRDRFDSFLDDDEPEDDEPEDDDDDKD